MPTPHDHYFGIVTRTPADWTATVELPARPPLTVTTAGSDTLADEMTAALADALALSPDDVDVTLWGHDGGDGTPCYAAAAVFDGSAWRTVFPAQEDLPAALAVAPSPTAELASARALLALAEATGRDEDDLDFEFFEIVPDHLAPPSS